MRTREAVRELALELVGEVLELLRVTERIVGEEALHPQTLAPHRRVTHLAAEAHREAAERAAVLGPHLTLTHVGVVVVAELVALLHVAGVAVLHVVEQVVLVDRRIDVAVVAQGELVNVEPVVGTQQVLHLIVVLRAVDAGRQSAAQHRLVLERVRDVGHEVEVTLVRVTLLDHVDTALARLIAQVVALEHLVEVDHALVGIRHPLLPGLERQIVVGAGTHGIEIAVGRLVDAVLVVARQVAVVVRTRVGTVGPRQRRIAVLAEAERRGGQQLRARRDVETVVEHHDRLVVGAHARIAQLAVLTAHVGVVVVVAQQVVSLLRRGLLCTALGGSAHHGQGQRVAVVAETLLDRSEVTVGVIVDAVHIAVAALARRERQRIRPAVVQQTRSVGDHRTEAVHRVGVDDAGAESLPHLRSPGVDVRRTADAVDAEARRLQAGGALLVARRVVQAAPQRPGAVARHGVVETDAVQVDVGILRIVAADVEAHLAEAVRGDVVEDVPRRGERRGKRLHVGRRVGIELGEDRVVDDGLHVGNHHDGVHLLDRLADTDHDVEVFKLGSLELEAVVALGQLADIEMALVVGHDGDSERFDDHLHVAQGGAAVTRDDLALDTAFLGIRPDAHKREQADK